MDWYYTDKDKVDFSMITYPKLWFLPSCKHLLGVFPYLKQQQKKCPAGRTVFNF